MIMLYNNIITEIKRVVFSKYFIILLIVLYLGTLFTCVYSFSGEEYYVIDYLLNNELVQFNRITLDNTFYSCVYSNIIEMILPAIMGFPISMCFCDDTKTHNNRFILIRTTKKNYIISKIIAIIIYVLIAWIIVLALYYISILSICEHDMVHFHIEFLFLVFISICYALFNLMFAILLKDIYSAVCLPFLICYILSCYSSFFIRKNTIDLNVAILINPYRIISIGNLDLDIALKIILFILPPIILINLISIFFNRGVDICE